MTLDPALVTALAAVLAACLGWWRESRKDRSIERRSDMDVVLNGYQLLLKDQDAMRVTTKEEVATAMARALDCEEREQALNDRVGLLERAVRRLGGAI